MNLFMKKRQCHWYTIIWRRKCPCYSFFHELVDASQKEKSEKREKREEKQEKKRTKRKERREER